MQQYLKRLVIGLTLLFTSVSGFTQSYIYLTNNTEQELTLTIKQYGASLDKGKHWQQHATFVPPLATVRFLEVNRDTGIIWGESYYFDTQVTSEDGSSTILQQKLTGTWNFSNIWHGMAQSPWFDDKNIHTITQSFVGSNTSIAVKAQSARINGDDFYYVIHPKPQYPSRGNNNNFKVLAYNVWALLPGIVSKNVTERLTLLTQELNGYDAIVFSELFDNNRRKAFLEGIKKEYPYQSKVVDRSGSLEDGGVLIVSRWPIDNQAQITYNNCDAEDCVAAKGVIYTKINKQGTNYHLFGTHTQAWSKPANQNTRLSQFQQMAEFIDSRNISSEEPVIIAGDLNVDKVNFPNEYSNMLTTLSAEEVSRTDGYLYTANGNVNYWTAAKPEILDYILYSTRYLRPINEKARVVVPRSIAANVFTQYDLSDHFAVKAEFTF